MLILTQPRYCLRPWASKYRDLDFAHAPTVVLSSLQL